MADRMLVEAWWPDLLKEHDGSGITLQGPGTVVFRRFTWRKEPAHRTPPFSATRPPRVFDRPRGHGSKSWSRELKTHNYLDDHFFPPEGKQFKTVKEVVIETDPYRPPPASSPASASSNDGTSKKTAIKSSGGALPMPPPQTPPAMVKLNSTHPWIETKKARTEPKGPPGEHPVGGEDPTNRQVLGMKRGEEK